MVSKLAVVLIGLLAIGMLLVGVVFAGENSRVSDVSEREVVGVIGGSVVVSEDYRYGCSLGGIDHVRGIGRCVYPVVNEKRCYREVIDGCNIKKVEVSCFYSVRQVSGDGFKEEIVQVRGDGDCFDDYGQMRKDCYVRNVHKGKGCYGKYGGESCFERVKQVRHDCDDRVRGKGCKKD